jgi:hypothetical protein
MRLVILESPYAGKTPELLARNVEYAKRAMRDCLMRHESPLASHLLYTQPGILNDDIPEERTLGINAGLAWSKVAHQAVFYIDFGYSPGMLAAVKRHQAEGTYIEYREIGTSICHDCHKANKTCPIYPIAAQSCGQYQKAR